MTTLLPPRPATPSPSPSPSPQDKWIAGLDDALLAVDLETAPRSMDCEVSTKSNTPTGERGGWTCDLLVSGMLQFRVQTFSLTHSQVDRVLAVIMVSTGPSAARDQIASTFLGYVAAWPYADDQSVYARNWVEKNISTPTKISTAFGNASLTLTKIVSRTGDPAYGLDMRSLGYGATP